MENMEIHVIHILMVLSDAYPNFTMAETFTTPTKESKNELTNNSNNKSSPNR
ncbi:hypothetical protein RhiirA4_546788 [Rhizophagus irregularis]|uniref:Uncharacterized protein n=1 Tax=Rhizophagus irregularis TaxID=588596 RepID=A0A2I1GYY7_9GLOM|nr:hypothetical protein RhiirA4_546788 [Rhizophagus irregularis]